MHQTLLLARHGETAWNKEQRLQGSKDIALSRSGIKQAEDLAENLSKFSIDSIITSNLQRAYQTAEIVGKKFGIPVERKQGFNERSYGELEGQLWPEVRKRFATLSDSSLDEYAEAFVVFSSRVLETLADVLRSHEDQKILIICHGGVLRVLLGYLRKTPSLSGDIGYELPNTVVYLFKRDGSNWVEKDFNIHSKLK